MKSNKPYKSLKDVYSENVTGHVAPRRHLRVMGEGWDETRRAFRAVSRVNQGITTRGEEGWGDLSWIKSPATKKAVEAVIELTGREQSKQAIMQQVERVENDPNKTDAEKDELILRMAKEALNAETPALIDRLLQGKGWDGHTKRYADELSARIFPRIELDEEDIDNLHQFFRDDSKHLDFPDTPTGNLHQIVTAGLEKVGLPLKPELITDLMKHKTQDARTRGIGMGELAMSLFFRNIKAAEGPGDLHKKTLPSAGPDGEGVIEGAQLALGKGPSGELELKGQGAALGPVPNSYDSMNMEHLNAMGINAGITGKTQTGADTEGILVGEKTFKKKGLAQAVSHAYKSADTKGKKDAFKNNFWAALTDGGQRLLLDSPDPKQIWQVYDKIDFKSPESINTTVGLMNFVRYATKEKFGHFVLHDYGQLPKKGHAGKPRNTGTYVYVYGKPLEMAEELSKMPDIDFEPIAINNGRPRLGHPVTGKGEGDNQQPYGIGLTPHTYIEKDESV